MAPFDGTRKTTLGSAPVSAHRSYLFLQGPIGPFFSKLGYRLQKKGHAVHRINFNGGDQVIWPLNGATDYCGDLEAWPRFLTERLAAWQITDIVLFGDCRPLHRTAIAQARLLGVPVHVFEEGYLRPNWVTLESGGVNRHSSLPRDAGWFRDTARSMADWDEGVPVNSSFARRALWDIVHNLSMLLLCWRFPNYRTHRPWKASVEYWAGTKRFPFRYWAKRRAARILDGLRSQTHPFYLFPLQLDADSQIRFHSPFGRMAPAIDQVIDSFARCAPAEALLVISEHPLDIGVIDQKRITREYAQAAGVESRVIYLEGGSPVELLQKSRGVVTVNSTLGILALSFGVPVKPLGHAIYDMKDLTFQGPLDAFWNGAAAPDAATFQAFRKVVGASTQVNGSFFCGPGRALAVEDSVRRLTGVLPHAHSLRFSTVKHHHYPWSRQEQELLRPLPAQSATADLG